MSLKLKKYYKKIAFALSLCTIIIWVVLGAGTSLAWFTDTSDQVINIFNTANFDLEVSYRLEDGSYEAIDGKTEIFDTDDIYEPGFVKVVYLKVENKGDIPFEFKVAINANDYIVSTNKAGEEIRLKEYLRFGLAQASSENDILLKTADRSMAINIAKERLNDYASDGVTVGAGKEAYVALVVRMPEEVNNEANYYSGEETPEVELGIIVTATQK